MVAEVIVVNLMASALIGGLLNVDRQAFGQFMLGRPLVVGFLVGLLWQQPALGMWLGMWAELWWSGQPPLGGQTSPNGALGVAGVTSGLAAALACGWLGGGPGQLGEQKLAVAAIGGGGLAPASYLAAKLERLHRCWAHRLGAFLNGRGFARPRPLCRLRWQIMASGWIAASGALFIFITSLAVMALGAALARVLPVFAIRGLALAPPLLTLLGLAAVVGASPRLSVLPFYGAGVLASLLTITSFLKWF